MSDMFMTGIVVHAVFRIALVSKMIVVICRLVRNMIEVVLELAVVMG